MYELYVLNDHNFFFQKRNALFLCFIIITTKKWWIIRTSFLCVFFFSSENVFLRILLVWSDRFQCLDVRRLSLDVRRLSLDWEKNDLHEFQYVYIINVALIMLNQKGHFTHKFKVAICFKFDPLLHSSRLDITPFLSLYLTLPCPESWLHPPPPSLQQYTHIYTHNKYSWGSPVFQIHGLLIYVQPLYKTCVKGKKRIKFLWHLKMSFVCPVDF